MRLFDNFLGKAVLAIITLIVVTGILIPGVQATVSWATAAQNLRLQELIDYWTGQGYVAYADPYGGIHIGDRVLSDNGTQLKVDDTFISAPGTPDYTVGVNTATDDVPSSTGYWVKNGSTGQIVRSTTDAYADDDINYTIGLLPASGGVIAFTSGSFPVVFTGAADHIILVDKSNLTICGAGEATKIVLNANPSAAMRTVFEIYGSTSNITLSDFCIDTDIAADGSYDVMDIASWSGGNPNNIKLHNITFWHADRNCAYFSSGDGIKIEDCLSIGIADASLATQDAFYFSTDAVKNVWADKNQIYYCRMHAFLSDATGIKYTSNQIDTVYVEHGFYSQGAYAIATGNTVNNTGECAWRQILVGGGNTTSIISNNIFLNGGRLGWSMPLVYFGDTSDLPHHVLFTNNQIKSDYSASGVGGVGIDGHGLKQSRIDGNYIYNTHYAFVFSGCEDLDVDGNTADTCAGAAFYLHAFLAVNKRINFSNNKIIDASGGVGNFTLTNDAHKDITFSNNWKVKTGVYSRATFEGGASNINIRGLENSGTTTMLINTGAIVVTHSLGIAPTRVIFTMTSNPGLAVSTWADTYNSDNFTIHTSSNVTSATTFDWKAQVGDW